ncbi:MAG TPA: hypothetical protein VM686_29505, partial [Polyangiaceae bacterium]|nr:hypothetical protein [Polyangiaceae bacterium]
HQGGTAGSVSVPAGGAGAGGDTAVAGAGGVSDVGGAGGSNDVGGAGGNSELGGAGGAHDHGGMPGSGGAAGSEVGGASGAGGSIDVGGAAGAGGAPGPSCLPSQTIDVVNNSVTSYTILSQANPTLTLCRGNTYTFAVNATGHPFWIKTVKSTGTGNAYSSGVTNNGDDVGNVVFAVPLDAPDTLFYDCQIHLTMSGTLTIVD